MLSVVFAPAFYLAPTGFGLFLLWPLRNRHLAARLPIAFLVGAVFMTRLYELAEERHVVEEFFSDSIWWVALLSILGILGSVAWSRRTPVRWDAVALAAMIAVPSFFFCYFWISSYPFTDVFQDIHPMKMAEEFAKTHVLNGVDGMSYIPVKPVLNGLMIGAVDYDQLVGVWALAPWTAVFRLLVAWHATRLVGSDGNRVLAFVLLAGMLLAFDMTNGVMCAFGAILLLVELVEFGQRFERKPLGAAVVLLLPISVYLEWRFLGRDPVPSLVAMTLALATMAAVWSPQPQLGRALLVVVLVGCLVQLHRGSMLFVTVAAGAGAALTMRNSLAVLWPAAITGRFLLPIGLGASAIVIAASLSHISLPFSLEEFYVSILSSLIRVDGPETMLGTGAKNAAIEWVQAIGPLMAIMIGAVILWSTVTKLGRKIWAMPSFVIPWGLASGLTCVILTGLPYVYRSAPLACVFFAIALSVALPLLWFHLRQPLSLPALVLLGLGGMYGVLMLAVPSLSLYGRFYWPVLICLIAAAAATFYCMRAAPKYRGAVLVASIATAIAADRLSEKVALFPHVYGVPPSPVAYISHYGAEDLAAGEAIDQLPADTVAVSDPYTLSIVRARSGLNTTFSYSNLDTLNEFSETHLRGALLAIRAGDQSGFCTELREMMPIAGNYRHLLDRLHLSKSSIDVAVVFSSRTASWSDLLPGGRQSYFSSLGPLDAEIVQKLSAIDAGIRLVQGRIAMINVRCELPPGLLVQTRN
ncbi:hypothetical protein IVA87_20700 [Bradyrhizobium sp. 147]|uniref:hypothetical protein n=1 Tax=Bradyrhizobium sp. 147 TaxID=2782623 RepID=UPI001FF8CF71|nr:hypothetical protein [Bradyrhizobium sp. 147]MCK1681767.1 hypothetical protein [Bradyrhizobium sp. 147]